MAEIVLTDAHIELASNDVSGSANSVSLEGTADAQEKTAFGPGWRGRVGGLKDWAGSVDINQDFAATEIDSILWPLLGTRVAVEMRPTAAARGTSNPSYAGFAIITSYNPLGNSVGDLATSSVALMGDGELERLTS